MAPLTKGTAPYLLVEENDRGYDIVGVYSTFEEADTAAGRTRDRSHGGRPYTWFRIHQMVGEKVTAGWCFDSELQRWRTHYWNADTNSWISD